MKKKLLVTALTFAMLMSFSGCDKANSQVITAANEAAEAFASSDADDIIDACAKMKASKKKEVTAASESLLGNEVYSAILDTMSFTVDEESFEGSTKAGEASVNVVYTMVDYMTLFESDDIADVDGLIEALGDSEGTTEVTVNFAFELDGESWLVSNYDDIYAGLYTFLNATVPTYLDPEDFNISWNGSEDGSYLNATEINLDISYVGNDPEFDFSTGGIYYVISQSGNVIYTSESGINSVNYMGDGLTLENDRFIPSGNYDIAVMSGDTELFIGTAMVNYDSSVSTYSSRVDRTLWWTAEYYIGDTAYYFNNPDTIELGIIPVEESISSYETWNFYFEVYADDELVYTSPVNSDAGEYIEAYFYASNIGENILPYGHYTIVFYDADGCQITQDSCYIAEQFSDVFPEYQTTFDESVLINCNWVPGFSIGEDRGFTSLYGYNLYLELFPNSANENSLHTYFEVYNNNGQDLIYTSDTDREGVENFHLIVFPEDLGFEGNFPSDVYRFVVYNADTNEVIVDGCCAVVAEAYEVNDLG